MAYLIAAANGNLTDAATWGSVDGTSLLDSEANSTTLTNAYVESATFTPGAITIDGIAVKVATRVASPSGTMSVRLAQGGATVAGTEVTINVSDIVGISASAEVAGRFGWIFFKFAAPVTLLAATLYTVSAKTQNATQVGLYRNATAGNWSRCLRTTTTAAPGAGDSMFILGEWTAAATKTNRTVTMDSTAATDYGGASTTLTSLGIGVGGTLAYATAAATNYVLRLSGLLDVWAGGTFTIGTDPTAGGTAIPRDSTAVLEFDCAADGDFGLRQFCPQTTVQMHGLSRTSGKNVVQCLLNTDEAIAQTVLGVDTDTGWLNGDVIAIASTTQTVDASETATLSGNAAATTITVTAGIAAAHGGSAATLVQAEVILLTRNVMVRSTLSTSASYFGYWGTNSNNAGGTINISWTDFRYMGAPSGVGKTAAIGTASLGLPATITLSFCCFRDGEKNALDFPSSSVAGDMTLTASDTVFYNIGHSSSTNTCFGIGAQSAATITTVLTRCTCIWDNATSSSYGFLTVDDNGPFTMTDCRVSSGSGTAVKYNGSSSTTTDVYATVKRIVGCNFHSMGSVVGGTAAINIAPTAGTMGLQIVNSVFWRIASASGAISMAACGVDLQITGCTFFGNNGQALITTASGFFNVLIRDSSFSGDSTFGTNYFFTSNQNGCVLYLRCENCTFGVATGIRVAHAVAALHCAASIVTAWYYEVTFVNCNIADATEVHANFLAAGAGRSFVVKHRKDQVTNVHEKNYPRFGTVAYETTTFRTAAPSQKLTPAVGSSTYFKLCSSMKTYPVASGKKITFSAYVQKDGSYNGNAPRLVLLANPALGIDDDTVLDTLSVGSGTWELLSGQMSVNAEENGAVQAVVECDGSAGNVYVDDWSASTT